MWLTNFNLNLKSHSTPSTYNEEELNTNQKKCNQQMEMKRYAYFRIAMLVMVFISAHAEQEDRSCANKLVPCLNYLNGTRNPPDDCCDPLKSVIKSNPECLCSLITNKGTKQAREAGIDVNEAQQLPARCGQHVNPISCLTDSGGSSDSKNSDENSACGNERMVFMFGAWSIIIQVLWMSDIHL